MIPSGLLNWLENVMWTPPPENSWISPSDGYIRRLVRSGLPFLRVGHINATNSRPPRFALGYLTVMLSKTWRSRAFAFGSPLGYWQSAVTMRPPLTLVHAIPSTNEPLWPMRRR